MVNPNFTPMFTVMLLGDSIIQHAVQVKGWQQLLSTYYEQKGGFQNFGLKDSNSWQQLQISSDPVFQTYAPPHVNKIFISIGTNDALYGSEDQTQQQWQGIKLERYIDNMQQLYEELAKKYNTDNITILIPPVSTDSKRQTELYADSLRQMCIQNNINYLDVRTKIKPNDDILIDEVNLNDLGNKYYFEMASAEIGTLPQFNKHWVDWTFCSSDQHWDKITSYCLPN